MIQKSTVFILFFIFIHALVLGATPEEERLKSRFESLLNNPLSSSELQAKDIFAFNRELNRLFHFQNPCTSITLYPMTEIAPITADNFIEFLTLLVDNKTTIFKFDGGSHIDFNAPLEIQLLQYIIFLTGSNKAKNDFHIAKQIVGIPFVENNRSFFEYLSNIISANTFLNDIQNQFLSQDYYTMAFDDCIKKDWSEYINK